MPRIVPFFAWIPAGLILPLVLLDGAKYEGYTAEPRELMTVAFVLAGLAGLVLGLAYARRVGVLALLVEAGLMAVFYLIAHDLLYGGVIPMDGPSPAWWPGVVGAVAAAAVGLALGRLVLGRVRRPAEPGPPGRRWYAFALAALCAGVLVFPSFVRIGAEMSTSGFEAAGAASGVLPPGRHAVYSLWGTWDCDVTADGSPVPLDRPAVQLTDNSDSIVAVLVGTFDLDRESTVVADCPEASLGPPPITKEPFATLIDRPAWWMWTIAVLPGLLTALWVWAARRTRARVSTG